LHLAGAAPLRTTKDVDIVADVLADFHAWQRAR
jgi:hypothetical protein